MHGPGGVGIYLGMTLFEDEEGTIEVNMSMVSFSSSQLLSDNGSGIHVGGDLSLGGHM